MSLSVFTIVSLCVHRSVDWLRFYDQTLKSSTTKYIFTWIFCYMQDEINSSRPPNRFTSIRGFGWEYLSILLLLSSVTNEADVQRTKPQNWILRMRFEKMRYATQCCGERCKYSINDRKSQSFPFSSNRIVSKRSNNRCVPLLFFNDHVYCSLDNIVLERSAMFSLHSPLYGTTVQCPSPTELSHSNYAFLMRLYSSVTFSHHISTPRNTHTAVC